MSRETACTRRKALSLLALAACLAAAPGCGDEPPKVAPPPEDKGSNSEMIDFMNSQKATKKKK